jgi:ribosomal protein L37AE/L43A
MKPICPKCQSENIATERRINGDSICLSCLFKGKIEEFYKPKDPAIKNINLPTRKTVICPKCKQKIETRSDSKVKCCGVEL